MKKMRKIGMLLFCAMTASQATFAHASSLYSQLSKIKEGSIVFNQDVRSDEYGNIVVSSGEAKPGINNTFNPSYRYGTGPYCNIRTKIRSEAGAMIRANKEFKIQNVSYVHRDGNTKFEEFAVNIVLENAAGNPVLYMACRRDPALNTEGMTIEEFNEIVGKVLTLKIDYEGPVEIQ